MNWPEGKYKAILADPPWSYQNYSKKGEHKGAAAQYSCMDLDDLKALPVGDLTNPDGCAMVMWATAPLLPEAFELMKAWGFTFKSAGAWAKQSSTGNKWGFGTGYLYRSAAEFYLLGVKGKPKARAKNVRNLIVAPVRGHSRKPERMYEDIEALFEGPYLELFARNTRTGWDSWGNEVDKYA